MYILTFIGWLLEPFCHCGFQLNTRKAYMSAVPTRDGYITHTHWTGPGRDDLRSSGLDNWHRPYSEETTTKRVKQITAACASILKGWWQQLKDVHISRNSWRCQLCTHLFNGKYSKLSLTKQTQEFLSFRTSISLLDTILRAHILGCIAPHPTLPPWTGANLQFSGIDQLATFVTLVSPSILQEKQTSRERGCQREKWRWTLTS